MHDQNALDGWTTCCLGEIVSAQYGTSAASAPDGNCFVVGMAHVTDGMVHMENLSRATLQPDEVRTLALHKGDLLFNRTNSFALVGKVGVVLTEPATPTVFASYMIRLVPSSSRVTGRYLSAWMQRGDSVQRVKSLATPGVSQYNINPTTLLRHFYITLPSIEEQASILRILDGWDHGIRRVNRLAKARRKLKRGLLQQLLTGERRFPEFRDQPWVERRVGDVLQETSRLLDWNDDELYRLASIRRGSRGLFDRGSLYGRDIKVKKLHTIREGDFLISHIQAAYGAMGTVPAEFDGAKVSDMYSILTPKEPGCIDMRFVNYLSQRKEMRHMAYLASNGFFAERLRLNFDPHDFLNRPLLLPPTVAEQSRIADTLETLDHEIQLLTDLHEALKEQKKGLMQQLLTGKVRVPASMLKEASHA